MLVKASILLVALTLVQAILKQFPIDESNNLHKLLQDPLTMRCGTGSNTQKCPEKYKCTAPSDCERYIMGVHYEGCVGVCIPDV